MIGNRFVRWTLAGSALLVAALVGAGVAWGPSLLTSARSRALVEAGAARLGLTLRIVGPVRLTLLPRPALVAEGVSVTGPGGFSGAAGRLTADLAFGPLLRGTFAPRDVTLRDAELDVPLSVALVSAPESPATLRLADTRVTFGRFDFEHVDAAVALYGGKLRLDGAATWHGQRWRLAAAREPPAADGAAAVQATLEGEGAQAGVAVTAALRVAPDGAVTGHAAMRGPDLSVVLPGPAVAFAAEGRITGDATLLIADTLGVTLAGQPLQGSVTARLRPAPRIDVAFTAGRFDVRPWLAAVSQASPGVPVGVDLSAEEVPVPAGAARQVRLVAELDRHGPTWREVAATLPGDARLRYLRRAAAGPETVDGHATLAVPDPPATLAWVRRTEWLPADLAAVPDPPTTPLDIAADTLVTTDKIRLDAITGSFGPARVTGRLAAARADGASAGGAWPVEASVALEPIAVSSRWPVALALCASRPISVDVSLARGSFADAPLRDGHARLRCEPTGGTLVADATLNGGLDARFAAGVAPTGAPRALDLSLIAPRTAMAAPLLPAWAARTLRALGLDGRPGWLRMRAEATNGPWTVAARSGPLAVTATVSGTAERWSGDVRVGADTVAALELPARLAAWLGAGPLALAGDVAATPTGARVTAGSFAAGTVAGRVEGTADDGHIEGSVAVDAAPLPPGLFGLRELDGWTGTAELRAGQLGPLSAFSASAQLDERSLSLRDIRARVAGGTISGEASAIRAEPPEVAVAVAGHDLSLRGVAVPRLALNGTFDGMARLTTSGTSIDQLASALSGTVGATVANAVLDGADLAALGVAILRGDRPASMPAGVTAQLNGPLALRAAGGLVAIDAAILDAPAGRIVPSGVLDFTAGTLDLRLDLTPRLRGPRADPTLTWRVAGPLADPIATLDPAGLDLWRATGEQAVGQPVSATAPSDPASGDPAPRGPAPPGGRRR